jgi:hypothetical protein
MQLGFETSFLAWFLGYVGNTSQFVVVVVDVVVDIVSQEACWYTR